MEKKLFDLTVIGAGPVGLFGVFYAGMRGLSVNVLDSLEMVGGQLNALYPEKFIYDMPGFPKVMAKDLVKQLWEQAEFAKPALHLGRKVTKINQVGGSGNRVLDIQCENGESFHSRTVMLALGMGAFKPRKLEVPGLEPREGKNVHYFVHSLDRFNNKDVLVIGGGDSAADWTLALSAPDANGKVRAKSVTMIHRTDRFAAHEATIHQIRALSHAKIVTHTELQALEDEGKRLKCALIQNLTKEATTKTFDDIIICAGYLAKLDFVKESGLEMHGNAVKVNEKMETNVPGIFAVGDVCTHGGKLKLIATGVGEAAIAANFAKVFIDPTAKAFPGHSTTIFAKKEE
ncbi:MAG TPA: NAD(P)/FAD-dependent oxidoreductase [Bdellovibrionota bacterium]|jgi:thioredoxin reductase (NADPH)